MCVQPALQQKRKSARGVFWLVTVQHNPGDTVEGKGPQRRPQRQFDRRLEEVAKAVWGGYCRLHIAIEPGTWRQGESGEA